MKTGIVNHHQNQNFSWWFFKKINTSSKGLYLKTVLTICKNSKQISICLKWKDKFKKFLFTILIYPYMCYRPKIDCSIPWLCILFMLYRTTLIISPLLEIYIVLHSSDTYRLSAEFLHSLTVHPVQFYDTALIRIKLLAIFSWNKIHS